MRSHAIACNIAFVPFIACDKAGGAVLGNVVHPDDFKNDGCSTMFIIVDGAGEAADEAEEEASTVLPRLVVVADSNRPPPPPPWAEAAVGSRGGGGGGGGGGRDAKGTTRGGAHDGTEGGRESEEEGEHVTRRETVRRR